MRYNENISQVKINDFKPIKVTEVEISQPLPEISPVDERGEYFYKRSLILVRLHNYPLGLLAMDFLPDSISPNQLAGEIWAVFGQQINQHLLQDGLPQKHNLNRKGFRPEHKPKCLEDYQKLLDDAPLISIVLSTRDRVKSLAATWDSLLELDYPRFEIILVDNAPQTNDTQDFFTHNQSRNLPDHISLQYVREDIPGLAVARNRGIKIAQGSIIAFTDDDVIVDRHWLAQILDGFMTDQSVGCVTGLVIPSELRTPAQALFEEFGGFTKGFTQQIYDLRNSQSSSPLFPYAAGRFGTGANMAFRTDLLQKTGGFDPALGVGTPTLGADDMDAFFQSITQGYQLVYQPSALVFHQHRRTYEGLKKQMFGYGVGLTAFLTKCIMKDPACLLDIISKIPAGLRYAFDPNSEKNQHKKNHYPRELESIERRGMLYGPMAYLISWWQYRNVRQSFATVEWDKEPLFSKH